MSQEQKELLTLNENRFSLLLKGFEIHKEVSLKFPAKYLAGVYLIKYKNVNTKRMYEICSKLIIKTPRPSQCPRSIIFVISYDCIHCSAVFPY